LKNYVQQAVRTESPSFHTVKSGDVANALLDFIAAAAQLDKLKRAIFYGKGTELFMTQMGPVFDGTDRTRRLLHGVLGIGSEGGELVEAFFKHVFEGKALNAVNLMEELGDVNWYEAIMCDELGLTLEQVLTANIAKLQARFPDKFTEAHALHRDLSFEEKILQAH
jgi:NTP pyrophosphatase (non-canonical NTP hydrolase)